MTPEDCNKLCKAAFDACTEIGGQIDVCETSQTDCKKRCAAQTVLKAAKLSPPRKMKQ